MWAILRRIPPTMPGPRQTASRGNLLPAPIPPPTEGPRPRPLLGSHHAGDNHNRPVIRSGDLHRQNLAEQRHIRLRVFARLNLQVINAANSVERRKNGLLEGDSNLFCAPFLRPIPAAGGLVPLVAAS